MGVEDINSLVDFHTAINSDQVVIVDFWAEWCGPCRQISPVFEKLSEEPEFSGIQFRKVNVDDQPDISQEVDVRAMPTFVVFQNGKKVDDHVGARSAGLQGLLSRAKGLLEP